MPDSMFQPFNYVVVNFYNSVVEKGHTDIYVFQNDNSGGSKPTTPEIDQSSNECKLTKNDKSDLSIGFPLGTATKRFSIYFTC